MKLKRHLIEAGRKAKACNGEETGARARLETALWHRSRKDRSNPEPGRILTMADMVSLVGNSSGETFLTTQEQNED